MSKAMLTHFGTVSLLHVAILFLGATAIQSELSKNNVPKFGNGGAIQLQLGSTFGKRAPAPVIARPVPKKVIANPVVSKFARPAPAPEVQKVVPTGSAQTTQGTSTVAGTGGNPNGHALGSGSTGTGKFDIVSLYKAELRAEIDKNKSYPAMSKRLGQTGTVVVAFTLHPDGNITDVRIDRPSQFDRLNASALEAVKKIERFKPIPKEAGEDKMAITVPLKFITI